MVLPTPGGPINKTLVASSRNRRVPSSLTRARSTLGWASKSWSESRQGAGSGAKRSRPAWQQVPVKDFRRWGLAGSRRDVDRPGHAGVEGAAVLVGAGRRESDLVTVAVVHGAGSQAGIGVEGDVVVDDAAVGPLDDAASGHLDGHGLELQLVRLVDGRGRGLAVDLLARWMVRGGGGRGPRRGGQQGGGDRRSEDGRQARSRSH